MLFNILYLLNEYSILWLYNLLLWNWCMKLVYLFSGALYIIWTIKNFLFHSQNHSGNVYLDWVYSYWTTTATVYSSLFFKLLSTANSFETLRGATTLSITTFSLMTLGSMGLNAVLRINDTVYKLCWLWRLLIVMLSIVMLDVVMLDVVMLNVVMLNVVMLSVVTSFCEFSDSQKTFLE